MVAAGFRYPAQPCAAAVADPSFANVALRMRAQSRSMMGALLGPLLPGRKTTELYWSCAHTGAPLSASFSPYLWGSGAHAGFLARRSRGPLRALGSSARPPQQPRASPPQRAHSWPSTRAADQTCRRSAPSERQTWGHCILAILKVQQVPGLQAVHEWSAAPHSGGCCASN